MSSAPKTHDVYVFRKANGGVYVHPSPIVVRPGDSLQFRNLTNGNGDATFRGKAALAPPIQILAQKASQPTPVNGNPGFHDYRVRLDFDGQEIIAEGGSDPGVIIEP